jgi:two-component system phosphate regulon sensor histidine kinase PhoR
LLDDAGCVVLVNAALRAMMGLGADVRGVPLLEVVRDASLHELLDRVREERAAVPGEIELPGAKPRRLMVHASPLVGEETGLLAVFVDVTELRRLESVRRDFVANVSHELRTPVASIQSAAETLEGGALDEPEHARRFVGIVSRNAVRLRALIEDLLELSRIESKELRMRKESVDVAEVVANVTALAKDRADKKGIALRPSVGAIRITGDPTALEQVIGNLVDNALKYCASGASVTISAAREGDRVTIRVADTGPGIDARHLPRIFERFYRVDPSRSRDLGGTGLGLSIVKHLAEAMRGTVAVESELGKGSTFIVVLPAA